LPVPSLQVLLVEDQDANIEMWRDKANTHNADADAKGFSVNTLQAKSVSEAQTVLAERKVDAVVVDLRLQSAGDGQPNDHGNKLVTHVIATHPVAMAIYTGQQMEADVTDCPQVEVFDRGGGLDPVFDWLGRQREMVMQLRSTRDAIERETARIFFKSIWPRWTHWTKDGAGDAIRAILARHVVAHVHDSMLDLGGGTAHAEETYFVPPLKERLDTGDLLKDDAGVWIVVSPRCDLANTGKIPTVLVALCEDVSQRWKNKPKDQGNMIQHDKALKVHFLPPMLDRQGQALGPWFVQFSHLRTVPMEEAKAALTDKRFASLAPQFVPSLVERFGAYFSRIGTPNFSSE
jgi:CheY-like chemotaxis protein